MKKKLLASALAMIMLFGMTLTVSAANYTESEIHEKMILHGGDTVTFEAPGDNVMLYFFSKYDNKGQSQDFIKGAGTLTVKPGTWIVNHDRFPYHAAASLNNNLVPYDSCFLPMVPYHFAEGTTKPEEIYSQVILTSKLALPNATVDIEAADAFYSLSNDVYAELAKRPDLTYRFHYTINGMNLVSTIPAGADLTPVSTVKGVHGFLYIGLLYGIAVE